MPSLRDLASRFMDGKDDSVEAHLVLATISILVFLALATWTVIIQNDPFNAQDFGIGLGAAFVGVGAAAWGKGKQQVEQASAEAIVARSDRADVVADARAEKL